MSEEEKTESHDDFTSSEMVLVKRNSGQADDIRTGSHSSFNLSSK